MSDDRYVLVTGAAGGLGRVTGQVWSLDGGFATEALIYPTHVRTRSKCGSPT